MRASLQKRLTTRINDFRKSTMEDGVHRVDSNREPQQLQFFEDIPVYDKEALENGSDSLNLVEFPLCTLYHQRNGAKSIEFRDTIVDRKTNKIIEREVAINGSDKYGLPSSHDDDILLALIQIAKMQNWPKRVYFTKRQLLRILGRNDGGRGTKLVEEAIKRWMGITVNFTHAWRNYDEGEWETHAFSIITNMYFKESQQNPSNASPSYIEWNDVVHESLKSGNLKPLNLVVFRSLKTPTAKRLYRFLDKRLRYRKFVKKAKVGDIIDLEFDLHDFATNKLGLKPNSHASELKRNLKKGLLELEEINYIVKASDTERYVKNSFSKKWTIYLNLIVQPEAKTVGRNIKSEVEAVLYSYGIGPKQAKEIDKNYDFERIQRHIDYLEFLLSEKGRTPKNIPGFLCASIIENYDAPSGYVSAEDRAKKDEALKKQAESAKQIQAAYKAEETYRKEKLHDIWEKREAEISEYLDRLSPDAREHFVQEAYKRAIAAGAIGIHEEGNFAEAIRSQALWEHYQKITKS